MELNSIEWKEFEIGKIFTIENCKCSNVSLLQNGNIPYVGATNRNNGVLKFVSNIENLVSKGNCLAFICDGEGSVGYSIYKREDFIGSTTVKIGRNNMLNKYNATFITTIADTVRSKYNFGFKRNETHLKKEKILLPTTPKGEPDYAFMEAFMKKKEQEKLEQYKNYIRKRIEQVEDFTLEVPLSEKKWGVFTFENIFSIFSTNSGIDKNKLISSKGNIPYITRTDRNNGIDFYIGDQISKYKIDKGNVITIGLDTQTVFFQTHEFYTGQNIQILSNNKLNYFNSHFLIPLIKRQMEKFSWGGNGATLTRLKRSKLMLPTNKNGQPDYDYMENYIKKIEYEKLTKYIANK